MDFLTFIIVLGGLALLWRRVSELKNRHERLQEYVADLAFRDQRPSDVTELQEPLADDESAPPQAPALLRERTSVPATRQELPQADAPELEEEPHPQAVRLAPGDEEGAEFEPRRGIDFEDLFGRLLPIWAGGVTLAVAGFFIVRYTIEAGLLTPEVRVLLGFLAFCSDSPYLAGPNSRTVSRRALPTSACARPLPGQDSLRSTLRSTSPAPITG